MDKIDKKEISPEAVRRLSLYFRRLKRLKGKGVETASSDQITKYLNISAEQCRKDLSYFGEFGKRGVGYDTVVLAGEISKILGTDSMLNVALVGVGKLGAALIGYPGFSEFNLKIAAAFDSDIGKIGKVWEGVKIEDVSRIPAVVKEMGIKLAVISVPAESAVETANLLVSAGIKAILNFTPVNLMLKEGVQVSNVDMASELASLVFKLKQ